MAQITFTVSSDKLPKFTEAFKKDYDQRKLDGEMEGITENQYAKDNAFQFLAAYVRKFHKQKATDEIVEVDITQ